MYCKNCGVRIKEGQEICPECGTEQDKPEYCGGFWGMVGKQWEDEASRQTQQQPEGQTSPRIQKQPAVERDRQRQEQEKQRLKTHYERVKKQYQRQKCYTAVMTGIAVLLAAACMILTILLLQYTQRPYEAVTSEVETEEMQTEEMQTEEMQTEEIRTDSGKIWNQTVRKQKNRTVMHRPEKQSLRRRQNDQKNQQQNRKSRTEKNRKDQTKTV